MPEDFKKNLKTWLVMTWLSQLPSVRPNTFIHAIDYLFLSERTDEPKEEKKEIDETFWELLMSADKKDYEGICSEYGMTDYRGMLRKLSEKKIEREIEQAQVCGFHGVILTSVCV